MAEVAKEPGANGQPTAELKRSDDGKATLVLGGDWRDGGPRPDFRRFEEALDAAAPQFLHFDTQGLGPWNSNLLTWLVKVRRACTARKIKVNQLGLPEGVQQLIEMYCSSPEKDTGQHESERGSLFSMVGRRTIRIFDAGAEFFEFLGLVTAAVGRLFTLKARFRWQDTWVIMQQVGAEALPIVTLISVLVGLILGFVSAEQLREFGSEIFVANLVGLVMVREMGAMMTAIIMTGRTGASFAAQLGSMKVTEEIDALKTLGISPIEFLVLPRVLALFLMMPLLTVYANFVGIFGGLVVGVFVFDIPFNQYISQTQFAIGIPSFFVGIGKSFAFGIIVAVAGCLRGMQCGSSSSAVGIAATSAVVTGVTALIVADAIFAVLFSILGI